MSQPTGWLNTDAVNLVDCPKCSAKKGDFCKTPTGRTASSVHIERHKALSIQRPDAVALSEAKGKELMQKSDENKAEIFSALSKVKKTKEVQSAEIRKKLLAKVMYQE